jgi:membrane protein required for colicin V production
LDFPGIFGRSGDFAGTGSALYARGMTWVDGVLLFVMAISAILSMSRGFLREALGLAAWVGAAVAGLAGREWLQRFYDGFVQPEWVSEGLAFATIFLAVLVVLKLLIHAIAVRVAASPLGGLDRTLGFVFGLARGAFLAVLAYILTGLVFPQTERWPEPVLEARALPIVADAAQSAVSMLPVEFRPKLVAPPYRAAPTQEDLLRPPARNRS